MTLAAPAVLLAQNPSRVRRIGVLAADADSNTKYLSSSLRNRGWIDGANLAIEKRSGSGNVELLQALASELVQLDVEVIVAFGTAATRPYTIAATAILAPVYGLGLCGLWSARYGTFPPRKPAPKRR